MNEALNLQKRPSISLASLENLCFVEDGFLFVDVVDDNTKETALFFQQNKAVTPYILLRSSQLPSINQQKTEEEIALEERTRTRLDGINSFLPHPKEKKVLIPHRGTLHLFCYDSMKLTQLPIENAVFPHWSPDGNWLVYVKKKDVYSYSIPLEKEYRLTTRSKETIWNGLAEFVAQEEMQRFDGFWISSDGLSVIFAHVDHTDVEVFHIQDPTTPFLAPNKFFYPRPGKKNATVTLGKVPIAGGPIQWLNWDQQNFPYLAKVVVQKGAPLTIVVQSRDQKKLCVLVEDSSVVWKKVLEETSDTWINLPQNVPYFLPDGASFFWTTETTKGKTLTLNHISSNSSKELINSAFHFSDFLHYEPRTQEIFFSTVPVTSQQLIAKVSLTSPSSITPLTPNNGVHQAVFGPNHYIVFSQNLTSLGIITLYDYSTTTPLLLNEKPLPDVPFLPIEIISVSTQNLTASIILPTASDDKKIPVLLDVYGGPGRPHIREIAQRYYSQQYFAKAGFAVVSIDGRGTPYKGYLFERAIYEDFATVTVADQVQGLQAMLDRYPMLDQNKIVVRGWSFGGYMSALLLMKHPEIFQAAVSGAPVVDWLDYDTHYTERYLGIPKLTDEIYQKSSLLFYANSLKKPLLLAHGTADDNVYFMHSLKLSHALFEAKIHHEFLPLLGCTHMLDGKTQSLFLETSLRFFQKSIG